jgi:hypothetical protein
MTTKVPDAVDAEVLEPGGVNTLALEAINRSEIDMQISTAKRYPRSLEKFRKSALAMATVDEETAASMFYALPRGGKLLEGPSARLAEIVVVCWGNVRAGARVVEVGDSYLSAQGVFHDLEQNVYVSMEVRRRITDSRNRRYNDDMIQTTGNAAASIAYRNVVFKGVPKTYVNAILREAKQVAIGKALSMEQRRAKVMEWFSKVGAVEADLLKLAALHAGAPRAGMADLTLDDIMMLRGVATALKDGETNLGEVMRPVREAEAAAAEQAKGGGAAAVPTTLDGLAASLQQKPTTAPPAAPAPTTTAAAASCDHAAIAVQLANVVPPEAIACTTCGELVEGKGRCTTCGELVEGKGRCTTCGELVEGKGREPGADDDEQPAATQADNRKAVEQLAGKAARQTRLKE